MKFNIESDVLHKIMHKAVLLIDEGNKDTVLSNILVHGEGNMLQFTASGFDAEVRFTIENDAGGTFDRTFPAKKMNNICRTLPSDSDISIDLSDQKVSRLNCGLSNFSLGTVDVSEFPSLHKQDLEASEAVVMDYENFREIISKTSFAMAVADVRPMLNGLLFDFRKDVLNVVATDGHRLAFCRHKIKFGGSDLQVILPRKIVERLDRILSKDGGEITIHTGERYLRVEQQGLSLLSRLVEGPYPDYDKVIPKTGAGGRMLADRQQLLDSLTRVGSLVSSEATAAAKMKVSNGLVHMSSRSAVGEEANDETNVEYEGSEVEINFNISYLKDALDRIPGEKARLELRDSVSSFMVLPEDNDDQKYLIMPMRV